MSSSPPPTHRDFDVAQMARQALFPKQINRDGSHTTLFPAVEALTRIRDKAMAWDPNRAPSSFFPKGIVVVREIGHEALKWNGQPEIEDTKASFDVIPNMLSVKCMECAELVPKTVQAFVSSSSSGNEHQEIVLCSDRLVKKDYKASATTGELLDVPPRSYAAVEEALAHQLTLAGIKLENNRNDGVKDTTTCPEMAASHVKAARAAEC